MIDLSRNGKETANSYIIQEPGNYCFPLVYGNALVDNKPNIIAYQNNALEGTQSPFYDHLDNTIDRPEIPYSIYETKVIAYDSSREFIRDLRIEGDYIKFQVIQVPDSGANYVIAVLGPSEEAIWSWHIWLWKDELEDVELDNGLSILNENLGSKKYSNLGRTRSLYYQWGRKDPFCGMFSSRIQFNYPKRPAETVGEAIRNPKTFYTQSSRYNSNWVKEHYYYNYWNANCYEDTKNEPVIKTIYDPCPPGYHVPQRDILNIHTYTILKSIGTMQIGKYSIKPVGYINDMVCRVYDLVDAFYYWTASHYNQRSANMFYLNSCGNLNRCDGFPRAIGLPIIPQKAL